MSVRIRLSGPSRRDGTSSTTPTTATTTTTTTIATPSTTTAGSEVAGPAAAGTKRKGAPDGDVVFETRVKRLQRERAGLDVVESVERTQELGRRLIAELTSAQDNGRLISEHFMELPDRGELPDYYETILLPIAFETVNDKLEKGEYKITAELEGDLLRMAANAKSYNERKSQIYNDADQLKKMVIRFMGQHNPAYRNARYQGKPTPIPPALKAAAAAAAAEAEAAAAAESSAVEAGERERRDGTAPADPSANAGTDMQTDAVTTPAGDRTAKVDGTADDDDDDDTSWIPDFSGMNLQQAHETILNSLINYEEPESGIDIYSPFVSLPPRSLTQYYRAIKHPVSLTSMMRRVKGIQTKGQHGKTTPFSSWESFVEEAAYIWKNARLFNEDGSDIVMLVGELEEHFNSLVEAARAHVTDPDGASMATTPTSATMATTTTVTPTPTLKVKGPPKPSIKLRLTPARKRSVGPAEHAPSAPAGAAAPATSSSRRKTPVPGPLAGVDTDRPRSRHGRPGSRQASLVAPESKVDEEKADTAAVETTESAVNDHTTPRRSKRSVSKGVTPARTSVRATSRALVEDGAPIPGKPVFGTADSAVSDDATGSARGDGQTDTPDADPPATAVAPKPARPNPHPFNKTAPLARSPNQEILLPSITVRSHSRSSSSPAVPPRSSSSSLSLSSTIPPDPDRLVINIPCSTESVVTSATTVVPSRHAFVEIIPTVPLAGVDGHPPAAAAAAATNGLDRSGSNGNVGVDPTTAKTVVPRPYRVIVLVNGQAVNPVLRASSPIGSTFTNSGGGASIPPSARFSGRPGSSSAVGGISGGGGAGPNSIVDGTSAPPSASTTVSSVFQPPSAHSSTPVTSLSQPHHQHQQHQQHQHQQRQPVRDLSRPVYEAALLPGVVNRIDVEVVAAPASAASAPASARLAKEAVQWERASVFIHVAP